MDLGGIKNVILTQGVNLLGGMAALVIGLFIVHWALKLLSRSARFQKIDPMVRGFLENLLKILLYVTVILTAAGIMGVPLTSFLTLLASASVAITLAMQGALSNFVGGVTVMLIKLLKPGDFVKVGETEGTVQKIGIFYTELTTPDNRHISMPNSALTGTAVVNYTREGTRRVDVTFSVSYPSDIDRVKQTLLGAVERTGGLLNEPEPIIRLNECASSSLDFTVKVWCRASDYWTVKWDLTENGKRALDAAGIEIPYPQLDVHMR
ncbi:MAG: mechanosensitive ion channel [Clostridia bacterium]|nr:mechanosensitive ion channel [Clostridia bacterium]MCR4577782.1 mechanosensitive ion channel [Clostridiales bacterium]